MIALRVVVAFSFESMKSTFSLRPATPPVALISFTAAFTPSTAPWNKPGLNGLSMSATTAMRISSLVTPTSVAPSLAVVPPNAGVPAASAPARASATTTVITIVRFTASPQACIGRSSPFRSSASKINLGFTHVCLG